MNGKKMVVVLLMGLLAILGTRAGSAEEVKAAGKGKPEPLCVSGVYPHLAVFNPKSSCECGIGAVVPWAGKLWLNTYSAGKPQGSNDKLYAIDDAFKMEIRPESVGGTPAGRLIHKESNQLFIAHHVIDAQGKVRTIDIKKMPMRVGAISRSLTDPANKVVYVHMEGPIYEVDVNTLEPKLLFKKPVAGWHGKGAYSGQGRFIIANNGENAVRIYPFDSNPVGGPAKNAEECGSLAEWDGKTWKIVERKQFCDVTGPGGIWGSPDDKSPVWAIGWDRRSVLLKLCEGGTWSTFRLPKASHTYDSTHGHFTEWPRIREITDGKYMMDMHGMFFEFPKTFSAANTAGIAPLASHLRMVPDFCAWNGRLVLAADDTTLFDNPMAGQVQSNLWFGQLEDLQSWGPRQGWGGPWVNDPVKAGVPSDPYLINGFARRVMHLAHGGDAPVRFTLEFDVKGDGTWQKGESIEVPAHGYKCYVIPSSFKAQWVRLTADRDVTSATAYFYYHAPGHDPAAGKTMFASLAGAGERGAVNGGLIRPGKESSNLLYVAQSAGRGGKVREGYYEVDETLSFSQPAENRARAVKKICEVNQPFTIASNSVVLEEKGVRYHLPKSHAAYDKPFVTGWPRALREVVTERSLLNAHGTIYLVPRIDGIRLIQPVCTHNKQIMDFCSWRGLLVLSGNKKNAKADGHYFGSREAGLWFGVVDDLWKLGKPVGKGGPWNGAAVKAGEPSDPYLMTGYDKKTVELTHDAAGPVTITVEVEVDHSGKFREYRRFSVPAAQTVKHVFPEGYSAHWVRLVANKDCTPRATFIYE